MSKIDILGNLPPEISLRVLRKLTKTDIDNSYKCCKKWRQRMNNDVLWRSIYQKFYYDHKEETHTKVYKEKLQSHSLHWQGRYMYNRALENNLYMGNFNSLRINFQGPFDFIHVGDRVIILSSISIIRGTLYFIVINASTGTVMWKFDTLPYIATLKHGDFLIALSENNGTGVLSLTVWNIENGERIASSSLNPNNNNNNDNIAHSLLTKLYACEQTILVSCLGYFLYAFNIATKESSYIGEGMAVNCTNEMIAIAYLNGNIEILNSNLNSLMTFKSSAARAIHKITLNDNFFVKLFTDQNNVSFVYILNLKTKDSFKIKKKYNLLHNDVIFKSKLIISIDSQKCEIWDLNKKKCLYEINAGKVINELIPLNYYIIFKCGNQRDDVRNRVWCLLTEKFIEDVYLPMEKSEFITATKTKMFYCYEDKTPSERNLLIYDYEANITKPEINNIENTVKINNSIDINSNVLSGLLHFFVDLNR